jgi:ABC-type antimicrobial peptide transport system permease subunit
MMYFPIQELKKRKKRYLLNVALIVLTVMMIITLNSLVLAYQNAAKLPFESIHSNIIIQKSGDVPENTTGAVLPCSLAAIPLSTVTDIQTIDGVQDVSAGLFLWVFDQDNFKRTLGVNWNDLLGQRILSKLVAGSLPTSGSDVLIEKTYADQYGIALNQTIQVADHSYVVRGIVSSSGKDLVSSDFFMNLSNAQEIAYVSPNLLATAPFAKDDINIIFVDTDQVKTKNVEEQLKSKLTKKTDDTGGKTPLGTTIGVFTVSSPETFGDQVSTVFLLSDRLATLLSAIILIGASVLIAKNMSHVLLERRKDFAIIKTVGWTRRDISREVFAETGIQVGIGLICGIIASFLAIALLAKTTITINIPWDLNPIPHFLTATPELASTVQTYPLPIEFSVMYALLAVCAVLVVSMVTTYFLIQRVNYIKPMEALKYE